MLRDEVVENMRAKSAELDPMVMDFKTVTNDMNNHISSYHSIHAALFVFNQLAGNRKNFKSWGFTDESQRKQFFRDSF